MPRDVNSKELAMDLKRTMTRLVKIMRRRMGKDEPFSLTELSTLGSIRRQSGITPSELAAKEKVTNQSMSQIIKKLSDHGYIKKRRSQKDKRKMLLQITSGGREYVEHRLLKKREWLSKAIMEKTTQSERETLLKAVEVLRKLTAESLD
jgi:DNA-binding MarR family transcriptional regulator